MTRVETNAGTRLQNGPSVEHDCSVSVEVELESVDDFKIDNVWRGGIDYTRRVVQFSVHYVVEHILEIVKTHGCNIFK